MGENEDRPSSDSAGGEGHIEELEQHPAPDKTSGEMPMHPKKEFRFVKPIDEIYDGSVGKTTDENKEPSEAGKTADTIKPEDGLETVDAGDSETPDLQDDRAEPQKGGKKHRRKRRGCVVALIYTLVILAISVIIAIFFISALQDMLGISKPDQTIDVVIPKGAGSANVAGILSKDGVIKNKYAFRLYVKLKKEGGFQVGTYTLNADMGYDEIISTLQNADNNKELVSVTIPEGKTLQQIGALLSAAGVCDSQDFIDATEKGGFTFSFDAQIPSGNKRFYKYEGYLFPDTYQLFKKSSGKTAAQKMLANFTTKFDATYQKRAAELNMSVDQIVTLASIIQSEAGKPAEMVKVSSVFHNRLKYGVSGKKLLQSDATIFYATKSIQPYLTQSDTNVASAYNTYKNEGLPPGPICNPGTEAIKAALYPEDTKYYYFVTDSSGNYYYSETYTQHIAAVNKALKSGSAKGTYVYK